MGKMMKILFLGNSHTYFNDMPQVFKEICQAYGIDVDVTMLAFPGVTYGWHLKEKYHLRFALTYGEYQYIIMQQASHSPCPSMEETLRDGTEIIELARKNGVTPIQTIPWAEERIPQNQEKINRIYQELHRRTGVTLNPVGYVFERLKEELPELSLYWKDGEHASCYGSYVNALTTFSTLFGGDVMRAPTRTRNLYPLTEEESRSVGPIMEKSATEVLVEERYACVIKKCVEQYCARKIGSAC